MKLFSIVAATIYIPIYKAQRLPFLHIFTNIISCLFKAAILTGVKWYFTEDMIYISLMICNVEHIFMLLLVRCMGFLEKYLARYSVYFKVRWFGFCCFYCWVVWVVCKFWTLTTLIWSACKYLLPFSKLSFHLDDGFICCAEGYKVDVVYIYSYLLLLPLFAVLNKKIHYQNWCQPHQLCFTLGVFQFQNLHSVWFFCMQFSSIHNTIWEVFPIAYSYPHSRFIVHKTWICFWALYSVPVIYVPFLGATTMPLWLWHCCPASHVWLFATPWTAAGQTSLPFTVSQSLPRPMSVESVMPPTISSSVVPFSCLQSCPASGYFSMSQLFASGGRSIRASVSASVPSMNIQGWFPLGLTGLISLLSKGLSRVFSSPTVWRHQFDTQPFLWSNSHIHTWLLEKP